MALSVFTMFCNHHYYPPPELFDHPKLNLCTHETITPDSPPLLAPGTHDSACCLYELDYSQYFISGIIQYLFFCVGRIALSQCLQNLPMLAWQSFYKDAIIVD